MTQNGIFVTPQPDTDYPVLVRKLGSNYELRIWELRLVVRGTDLQKAYHELFRRKQKMIDWAREVGSLAELPIPQRPPLLWRTEPPILSNGWCRA